MTYPIQPLTRLASTGLFTLFLTLGLSAQTASEGALAHNDEAAPGLSGTLTAKVTHSKTLAGLLERLDRFHYRDIEIDDETSSEVFDRYLEYLDSWRAYFLRSDIEEFERHRFGLDDAILGGDIAVAFEIFNRFQNRVTDRLDKLIAAVSDGLPEFDFTVDESLILDRSEEPWPATLEEADEIWRKRLKLEVLDRKLSGRTNEEIHDALVRMYENQLRRVLQIKDTDVFSTFIRALTQGYDPHTQYLPPRDAENFAIEMSLSLEGIGALLGSDGQYIRIQRIIPGGPAERSGELEATDRIVAVGEGDEGPMVDVVGWRTDDAVQLIRGKKGTVLRLSILPADRNDLSSARVIRLVRDEIKLEEQAAQKEVVTVEENGREFRIGLIVLDAFYMDFEGYRKGDPNYRSSTRDVRRIVGELSDEGVDGIVIDLRGNGGGSLMEAHDLTGLFLGKKPIVQVRDARGRVEVLWNESEQAWQGPLAVLVDRLSASASEIFAGAIQDYGRGLVLGARTFGKGTVQTIVPVDDGQLKLTQAKFYRISGGSTQHRGVVPDVSFPAGYDPEEIGESTLDEAMPWDDIEPLSVSRRDGIAKRVPRLRTAHRARSDVDPEFRFLQERMDFSAEQRHIKSVSLNEQTRQTVSERIDARLLEIGNRRRAALGQDPVESLDDLDREMPDPDPYQVEAARVLVDLLELMS